MSRVRWEVVTGRQDIILPSGEVIHFTLELEAVTGNLTQEEAGPQHRDLSLVYENTGDGSEGVLTYSPDTGAVFGTFETGDTGTIYTLEVGTVLLIFSHQVRRFIPYSMCDLQSLDHLGYVVWVEVDQDSLSHAEDTMEDIAVDPMEDMTKDTRQDTAKDTMEDMRQDVAPDTRTAALLARGAEDRETVRVEEILFVLLL